MSRALDISILSSLSAKVGKISLARFLGTLAGFALDAIILARFGLGSIMDAFFVALTIPMILVAVFRSQAGVLLPLFIHSKEQEGEREGWNFLNLIITNGLLFLVTISLLGILLSRSIISLQAPGFDTGNIVLAMRLSMILFVIPIFLCPAAIMERVMNSYEEFFVPASLRLIEHLTKIVFVLTLARFIGIYSLVYGIVVGAILQLLVVYLSLRRKGYSYTFRPSFKNPKLSKAIKLIGYPTLGFALGQIVNVLENFLMSFLLPGSLSALRIASRIVGALTRISIGGVATVILPVASKNVARNSMADMKENIQKGIAILLFITIPLCSWLVTMSTPLIRLMFERHQFTSADTLLVSHILMILIPYIFFSRLTSVFESAFFAAMDTWFPFIAMFFQAGLYATFSLILFSALEVFAFPLARSLSLILSSGLLLYLLTRKFGEFGLTQLIGSCFSILLASLNMIIFIIVGRWIITHISLDGLTYRIAGLFLPTFMGSVGFLFAASYLKLIELKQALAMIVPGKSEAQL